MLGEGVRVVLYLSMYQAEGQLAAGSLYFIVLACIYILVLILVDGEGCGNVTSDERKLL